MEPGLLAIPQHPSDAGIASVLESDVDRRAELHDIVHFDACKDSPVAVGRESAFPCRSSG